MKMRTNEEIGDERAGAYPRIGGVGEGVALPYWGRYRIGVEAKTTVFTVKFVCALCNARQSFDGRVEVQKSGAVTANAIFQDVGCTRCGVSNRVEWDIVGRPVAGDGEVMLLTRAWRAGPPAHA